MNKETVQSVIEEILKTYNYGQGYIEELGEDPYNNETTFYLSGPNGSILFMNIQLPEYVQDEEDLEDYILEIIRSEADAFDINEEFDEIYEKGKYSPTTFVQQLIEDKAYFDTI